MSSPLTDMGEERTVRALGLITLIRLPLRNVVLRGNSHWVSESSWAPLSKPIRYRLRTSFQRADGAHSIQVSTPCPLVVDRGKMPPRLTTSYVMITRVLASVLRSQKMAGR
jgi:hypothetical protein